ncbi:hypothetical protein LEN26_017052 [Aphanomyces euteiches]|nr:hypothetical protein LEN26_017052 [Aphanomyces euteiches]KAH9102174.1 hypothetical protein AeMF1_021213 [Aphanomyces euteiches]KAH9181443.1 hypothetical protein AeNC1_016580 [Aphanomyces euteiches]
MSEVDDNSDFETIQQSLKLENSTQVSDLTINNGTTSVLQQGSPPQKGGRVKRFKLEKLAKQKSFGETIAAAMDKQTAANLRSQEGLLQARQEEAKLRQSEANFHRDLKTQELAVLTREKRHQEIMTEAKLMIEIGMTKEEVLGYIREEKAPRYLNLMQTCINYSNVMDG